MKTYRLTIHFWLATLIGVSSIAWAISTQASSPKDLPTAPKTGTPPRTSRGSTRPGGGGGCPVMQPPLTPLVRNGKDFTLSEQPTFWIYFPYTQKQVHSIEFALYNARRSRTLYETTIPAPVSAGIVAIPTKLTSPLNLGENYRWELKLKCLPKVADEPDMVEIGWIQRRALSPTVAKQLQLTSQKQRTQLYLKAEGWYDALTNLAELLRKNPQDATLGSEWKALLQSAGWGELADQPLVSR